MTLRVKIGALVGVKGVRFRVTRLERGSPLKPDLQLVYAANRIIKASNVHHIKKCLTWYTHWCRVGNKAAMKTSEAVLRDEIRKAHAEERALQRAHSKAS